MATRCNNTNHIHYNRYGGRGITVCERWLKFENFLEDMGVRPEGYSLERANNELGYYKENCKWATQLEQMNNRCNNFNVTINGSTKTLTQWCRLMNVNTNTISARIHTHGWSPETAILTPVIKRNVRTKTT
jgi:hypothetical protein